MIFFFSRQNGSYCQNIILVSNAYHLLKEQFLSHIYLLKHFSGGWIRPGLRGIYKPKFKQLKSQLENLFTKNEIQVVGQEISGAVGYFEVEVESNNLLLHSKRNGQGFVDTPSKLEKIVQDIRQELLKEGSKK